jgi:very-short-patch-repair endonuclease
VKAEYETCGYQVDLVIKKYRLAIECDGAEFHSSLEQKQRDRKKTAYCHAKGAEVMNLFGPTSCRAVYYCKRCRQPFEGIKRV